MTGIYIKSTFIFQLDYITVVKFPICIPCHTQITTRVFFYIVVNIQKTCTYYIYLYI